MNEEGLVACREKMEEERTFVVVGSYISFIEITEFL